MRARALVIATVMLLSALSACTGSSASDLPPPASETGGTVTKVRTPEGEAAIELVIDKQSVGQGEPVTFRLVNRGDVPLLAGLKFTDERWNGKRWVKVPREGLSAWPLIGIKLAPGQSAEPQTWPFDDTEPEPGHYRITKSASYEGVPAKELVARAIFEVNSSW